VPPDALRSDGRRAIVEVRRACKTYDTGTRALANVDLDVGRGEFLTLVGPSGCGKSTLLSLIAGLTAPTAGRVQWWGSDFASTGGAGRKIGFVFQSPTLMPWARVTTNVRLPLDLAGVARASADDAVAKALARVHLTPFGDHLPRQLSGGMQMRASIARALVTEPDLLLMDEPFGALDEFTRQRLDDELLALWSSQRMTVVFVTHSIHEAVFLSSRVAVMGAHPGRMLDSWAIDAAFPRDDSFRLSREFVEHAQRLSACVASAGDGDALPNGAMP
jgi:NitT/TauT family transport system ATP-binding protein